MRREATLSRRHSKLSEFARVMSEGKAATPVATEEDEEEALLRNKEWIEKLIEDFDKKSKK